MGKPEHLAPVAENPGVVENIVNRAVLGGYTAGNPLLIPL